MLVSFEKAGREQVGVVIDNEIVTLQSACPELPDTMQALVSSQLIDAALEKAASASSTHRVAASSVQLLPPLPKPGKIVCFGLNYIDHAAESGFEKPDYPSIFIRGPSSLTPHLGPLVRPKSSSKLDFEGELVAVVGQRARHVKAAQAKSFICAYSCFNDGSVRDYQLRTTQWTIGKNFDKTGGFGPGLVSARKLPDLAVGLNLVSRLNGHVMQSANTRDMIFPIAEGLQIVTEAMTLEPGDILVMGTPSGVGQSRTPPVFLKNSDWVEVEIEGVGALVNAVIDED